MPLVESKNPVMPKKPVNKLGGGIVGAAKGAVGDVKSMGAAAPNKMGGLANKLKASQSLMNRGRDAMTGKPNPPVNPGLDVGPSQLPYQPPPPMINNALPSPEMPPQENMMPPGQLDLQPTQLPFDPGMMNPGINAGNPDMPQQMVNPRMMAYQQMQLRNMRNQPPQPFFRNNMMNNRAPNRGGPTY